MAGRSLEEMRRQRKSNRWLNVNLYLLEAEAFFIAVSPPLAIAALLLGLVLWSVRWIGGGKARVRALPFDRAILLFAAIGALSIFASPDRGFSFYNYYNLVGVYLLTYFLTGQLVRDEADFRRIVRAFAAGAVIVVGYGFYQYIFGIDISEMKWVDGEAFPELRKRVFSTWENPNILAGYLNEAICFVFAFFMTVREKKQRMVLGASLLALVACLAMTYARGACLSIAAVLGLYGIMRDRRVLLGCLVVGGAALVANPVLADRLLTAFSVVDTSSEMRLALWESTIEMICDHPFLGIGWGAYWMVYPQYDFYINDPTVLIVHAHNLYLNYAAEIGVFGALAYFWVFFGTMGKVLCAGGGTPFMRAFRLGTGLALLSVALGGMTDDVVFNIPTSMLLWMLFALAASSLSVREPTDDAGKTASEICPV